MRHEPRRALVEILPPKTIDVRRVVVIKAPCLEQRQLCYISFEYELIEVDGVENCFGCVLALPDQLVQLDKQVDQTWRHIQVLFSSATGPESTREPVFKEAMEPGCLQVPIDHQYALVNRTWIW